MILQKRRLDFKVCVIYFIMSYFVINGAIYPYITRDTKLIYLR